MQLVFPAQGGKLAMAMTQQAFSLESAASGMENQLMATEAQQEVVFPWLWNK